jgi:dTDP-4-dehydrorhamnose 3,5-epimerase-like enzyme
LHQWNDQRRALDEIDTVTRGSHLHQWNDQRRAIDEIDTVTRGSHLHQWNDQRRAIDEIDTVTRGSHLHQWNDQRRAIDEIDTVTRGSHLHQWNDQRRAIFMLSVWGSARLCRTWINKESIGTCKQKSRCTYPDKALKQPLTSRLIRSSMICSFVAWLTMVPTLFVP